MTYYIVIIPYAKVVEVLAMDLIKKRRSGAQIKGVKYPIQGDELPKLTRKSYIDLQYRSVISFEVPHLEEEELSIIQEHLFMMSSSFVDTLLYERKLNVKDEEKE